MKQHERRIKRHIISLRVSKEEWDILHERMKGLQFKNVSAIMREAFQLVMATPDSFQAATTDGQKRTG